MSSEVHAHRRVASGSAAFRWSVLLNAGLVGVQLVTGFGFGSLALIGDAIHNLGDVVGLLLSWGAERLAGWQANRRFTYGYGRSTQLASMANAALVMVAGGVVVVEGLQRLGRPVELGTTPVALAALAGLAVNLLSAWLFGPGHQHDLNRRAAVLHLLSDATLSATVLFSTLLIGLTGWTWLDSLVAIGVGFVVGWSGWRLMLEAGALLLDAVPGAVDLDAVEHSLLTIRGVCGVHHIHVWSLSTSKVALTAHLCRHQGVIDDETMLHEAQERLRKLGVQHATLQLEPVDGIGCDQVPAPE
ncbi:cation transporter [Synechococcus sp. Cruz-9H2]|uniref:cation diffusion facilitator family transporter n=1 Tax=unclassified Synechococcus TaxID=2626047 RepID=UPI0020CE6DB2|nr:MULTISPECIES: cation diffusion facilitator family transporter [unclassified Synechococcus]MCP9821031.1 cation transporter [Synechococcus sp. Cruz-9H2]MCP9845266.1 cation transporter [Synechococcus sp. Edmonson 11F2]MCP9857428.1 cation transporter [Synechococcus sp. Cruz-9C9]MCP9864673.1 cation transporter [Synechococcus sp. Cruz-7E5]MCP9871944.1 cation transporter [Synechococcus sp. Cruz-7B9]